MDISSLGGSGRIGTLPQKTEELKATDNAEVASKKNLGKASGAEERTEARQSAAETKVSQSPEGSNSNADSRPEARPRVSDAIARAAIQNFSGSDKSDEVDTKPSRDGVQKKSGASF